MSWRALAGRGCWWLKGKKSQQQTAKGWTLKVSRGLFPAGLGGLRREETPRAQTIAIISPPPKKNPRRTPIRNTHQLFCISCVAAGSRPPGDFSPRKLTPACTARLAITPLPPLANTHEKAISLYNQEGNIYPPSGRKGAGNGMLPPPSLRGCAVRGRGRSDSPGNVAARSEPVHLCPASPARGGTDLRLTRTSRRPPRCVCTFA